MEQTIKEIAPLLVNLESETAQDIVRQVLVFKYIEVEQVSTRMVNADGIKIEWDEAIIEVVEPK